MKVVVRIAIIVAFFFVIRACVTSHYEKHAVLPEFPKR